MTQNDTFFISWLRRRFGKSARQGYLAISSQFPVYKKSESGSHIGIPTILIHFSYKMLFPLILLISSSLLTVNGAEPSTRWDDPDISVPKDFAVNGCEYY